MIYIYRQILVAVLFLILAHSVFAKSPHLVAIGQGASTPTSTSTVNYSNGFTRENPVGVVFQKEFRASAMFDSGDGDGTPNSGTTGFGGEFGYGTGSFGVAVGFYDNGCDTCDSDAAIAMGGVLSGVGFGIRAEEEEFTFGLLFNPNGVHRIGVVGEIDAPENPNNDSMGFAFGYSYVGDPLTITLEASKSRHENGAVDDDAILLTPGMALRFEMFTVSLSYDFWINENTGTRDDDLWVGVGVGKDDSWTFALYVDYVNDFGLVGSIYF